MSIDKASICAVLLAGGKSSRMGENKALLKLGDKTFLDIQLDKLCRLDIEEILISGDPDVLGSAIDIQNYGKRIRIIPDVIKDKGPLGGLYSCFLNTECSMALVIGTDTPMIGTNTLERLIKYHTDNKKDATVLTAASHIEPLIAVYSTATGDTIKKLIDEDKLSMRSLLDRIDTCYPELVEDPSELYNCNTKEDYLLLLNR